MAEQMQHYRFTVEEYHRMGKVGIIAADSRVELIRGQIVVMSPIGDLHFKCVNSYNKVLMTLPLQAWEVSVQNPIRLADDSEPQPDIALLPIDYDGGIPTPEHVLLVIEVSDSTLAYDRRVKVPLYAAAGIPEVWITDTRTLFQRATRWALSGRHAGAAWRAVDFALSADANLCR
jgi:Uma2 family endonuclease